MNASTTLSSVTSNDLFHKCLVGAKKKNEIVSILLKNESPEIRGYVKRIGPKICEILELDLDSEEEGVTVIQLEQVERLVWGGIEERKSHVFYEHRESTRGS